MRLGPFVRFPGLQLRLGPSPKKTICRWGLMYSYGQNDHRRAFVAGSQVRLDY